MPSSLIRNGWVAKRLTCAGEDNNGKVLMKMFFKNVGFPKANSPFLFFKTLHCRDEKKIPMVTAKVRGQIVTPLCVPQHIIRRTQKGIFLNGIAEQKIYNVARTTNSCSGYSPTKWKSQGPANEGLNPLSGRAARQR